VCIYTHIYDRERDRGLHWRLTYELLSLFGRHLAVDAHAAEASVGETLLEDVERGLELGEGGERSKCKSLILQFNS